ncbi:MAG: hypothetical protein H6670_08110 [Anaerolineaceae bacterium]|nr:hypothetical protein [Anaerolineaceae bacterium]
MLNFFQSVMNPEWYHGHTHSAPFFESWTYKLVSAEQDAVLAIIPGVFMDVTGKNNHAFVQVFDGLSGQTTYFRMGSFVAEQNAFDLRMDKCQFGPNGFSLNIDNEFGSVQGEVTFGELQPWPVKLTSPGTMGRTGWLPNMEYRHSVLSFDHVINGELTINGKTIDFSGGRGYLKNDWGIAYPQGSIWMQCNHFETPGTALSGMAYIVPTPFDGEFAAFSIGLLHDNQLFAFGNYNGAKIGKLEITDDGIEWLLYNNTHELSIKASRPATGLITVANREDMDRQIAQTLKAEYEVTLNALDGVRRLPLFAGQGQMGALEIDQLDALLKRLPIE